MIKIVNNKSLVKDKLDENIKFRTLLKKYANQEKINVEYKRLHEKYFAIYDCSKYRNCCIKLKNIIPECDLKRDAEYLGVIVSEFINKYLVDKPSNYGYETKNCPCDLLIDKECALDDYMPKTCKTHLHTNKDMRKASMLSIVDNESICPTVYDNNRRTKENIQFSLIH